MSDLDLAPRRRPKQARSRARFDAILESARALIGEAGNDAVSVREIASHAGVPIASVYQYFPSKTAILRRLMLGYYDEITARLAAVFRDVGSIDALLDASDAAIDAVVDLFATESALTNIWAGVQADPTLRELDAADNLEKATFLGGLAKQMMPDVDEEQIVDACLFAATIVGHVAGVSATTDDETRTRLIRETKRMMRLRIAELGAGQRQARR